MKFLTNLTLGKKITLLTATGLLLGVGVFSTLSMRAVNQATQTMLQDRMTTAHIVAVYVDESLGQALIELEQTALTIEGDVAKNKLESQIEMLEATYSRLSIYVNGAYLISSDGQIIWKKMDTLEVDDIDISSYPSISAAIERSEPTISGLVSDPVVNMPAVLLASPINIEQIVMAGTMK